MEDFFPPNKKSSKKDGPTFFSFPKFPGSGAGKVAQVLGGMLLKSGSLNRKHWWSHVAYLIWHGNPYKTKQYHLVGGNSKILFIFHPDPLGEMIQFDVHIFSDGWFNHQLDRNTGVSLFSHLIWVFFRTSKLHLEVRGPLFWSCPRGDPEGSYRWLYWRWCLCLRSKSFEAADSFMAFHRGWCENEESGCGP